MRTLLLSLAASLFVLPQARGAVIISGDFLAGTGQVQFTEDITFNITANGSAIFIVFDELVSTYDGISTLAYPNPSPSNINYSINGGPDSSATLQNFYDNFGATAGGLTPLDGLFAMNSFAVSMGNTLTIRAGTWNFNAISGFNPQVLGSFTGDLFIAGSGAVKISDSVSAVPEASTALLAIFASGLLLRRKR